VALIHNPKIQQPLNLGKSDVFFNYEKQMFFKSVNCERTEVSKTILKYFE